MVRPPLWLRAFLVTGLLAAWLGTPAAVSAQTEAAAPEPAAESTLEDEIQKKLVRFAELDEEISALIQKIDATEGDEQSGVKFQARERWMDAIGIGHELSADWMAAREAGTDLGDLEPRIREVLGTITGSIPKILDRGEQQLAELRKAFESAEPGTAEAIQNEIAHVVENRTTLERQYLDHITDLEAVGADASAARADLSQRMTAQADSLEGSIQMAAEELANARQREADLPGDAERAEEARIAKQRLDVTAASLRESVAIMAALDLETADYRRQLIESTGEISGDIFDREVATGLVQQWSEGAAEWARSHAPTVLFRILLFGFVLFLTAAAARLVRHLVERAVSGSRARMTQLARHMVINISGRIVWILGLLMAVSQLGVEIGPLLAGLGVAGFIIGFALQDTLGNFASGAMLLIYRPYDVGDLVEVAGGVFGNVNQMSLVSTTILTVDNQTLVIPNTKIWGDVIKNVTAQRHRRIDMKFGISYGDDILHAQQIFESILKEHPKVLDDPESVVRVHELGDSSVNFVVRPWVNTEDYWDVHWDVTREVKLQLDREGISIPFPQQDVHFHPVEARSVEPRSEKDRETPGARAPGIEQKHVGQVAGDVDGHVDDQ